MSPILGQYRLRHPSIPGDDITGAIKKTIDSLYSRTFFDYTAGAHLIVDANHGYLFEDKGRSYSWIKNIVHAGLNAAFLAALYFCPRKKLIATLYAAYWSMPLVSMLAAYFSLNKNLINNFDKCYTDYTHFIKNLNQHLEKINNQPTEQLTNELSNRGVGNQTVRFMANGKFSLKGKYEEIKFDKEPKSDQEKFKYMLAFSNQISEFVENEYEEMIKTNAGDPSRQFEQTQNRWKENEYYSQQNIKSDEIQSQIIKNKKDIVLAALNFVAGGTRLGSSNPVNR
jgi:hypothetical protein